jgi:hypothetical protein
LLYYKFSTFATQGLNRDGEYLRTIKSAELERSEQVLKDEIPLIIQQSKQLGEHARQVERTVREQQWQRAATDWRIVLGKTEELTDVRKVVLDIKERNVQLTRQLEEWKDYKMRLERYWQGLAKQLSVQSPVEAVVSTKDEWKQGVVKVRRKGVKGVMVCYVGDEVYKAEEAVIRSFIGE